jgi:hypothetical protein
MAVKSGHRNKEIRELKTADVKFTRGTAGYSLLDHRRNEDISEPKADAVAKKLAQYKQ